LHLPIGRIHIIVTLWLAGNAIAFVQTCIEPLWRIGYAHLVQNRINQFIIKHLGVFRGSEITIAFAPGLPAIREAMRYLFGRCFATEGTIGLGYAGLTEIFLRQD